MAVSTIPFRGFADGEYGTLDPSLVGFALYRQRLLYRGHWTGQNVIRTMGGSLCPRAGEKPYILTGVPVGKVNAMGVYHAVAGSIYVWFSVADTVYRFVATNFASQAVSAYTGTLVEDAGHVIDNGTVSYHLSTSGIYKLNHSTLAVTTITAGIAAHGAAVYGKRAVTAASGTLRYSAAANFDDWSAPAGGSIPVGDGSAINAVANIRSSLAIGKTGSGSRPWFVLSGTPGENDVVRPAEVSATPQRPEQAVDTGAGVGFVSANDGTINIFDGVRVTNLDHLVVTSSETSATATIPAEVTCFSLKRRGEWGIVTDKSVDAQDATAGSIWLYRNGAWTRHRRAIATGITNGAYSVSVRDAGYVVFAQGGDSGTAATFRAWNPYLDRPPFASDAGTTVIDPSLVNFTLPEWTELGPEQVAVRSVIVDFTSYNTGGSDNQFTVNAVATRRTDALADSSGTAVTWTEAVGLSATTGTRKQYTANFELSYGSAFRIDFSALRGVAISGVIVVLESRPLPEVVR